jgi:DNA-binding SARP family transcriptional activator
VDVTAVRITLLGGFEVVVDGHEVPPVQWRRRQAAALVKLLALAGLAGRGPGPHPALRCRH